MPLIAALITGSLGIVGGLLLGRRQEKQAQVDRRAEQVRQYNEKAVQVLSKVLIVIQSVRPDGLIVETHQGQSAERLHKAQAEFGDQRHTRMEVAVGHTDKKVRDALSKVLGEHSWAVFSSGAMFVYSFSSQRADLMQRVPELRKEANDAWETFKANIDEAISLLHAAANS